MQDKDKALLSEIIAKLNDLFTGELTDDDKVGYVGPPEKSQIHCAAVDVSSFLGKDL